MPIRPYFASVPCNIGDGVPGGVGVAFDASSGADATFTRSIGTSSLNVLSQRGAFLSINIDLSFTFVTLCGAVATSANLWRLST